MDAVAKRQLALATFVLIQSAKMVDWWNFQLSAGMLWGSSPYLTSVSSLLLRWTIMEGIFMLLLWLAKVPRLTFTLTVSLVITTVFTGLNVSILLGLPLALRSFRGILTSTSMVTIRREEAGGGDVDLVIDDIAGSRDQFIEGMLVAL